MKSPLNVINLVLIALILGATVLVWGSGVEAEPDPLDLFYHFTGR